MAKLELHPDFKDFLKLLNLHQVKYLLVGGYAVGYYGYPRATADMDIWIEISESNAEKIKNAFLDFQMSPEAISKELFLKKDTIIRMGIPPVRLEVITDASGVNFSDCYSRKQRIEVEGIPVNFISLQDLKINKKAVGRHKDLEDLEHLPR